MAKNHPCISSGHATQAQPTRRVRQHPNDEAATQNRQWLGQIVTAVAKKLEETASSNCGILQASSIPGPDGWNFDCQFRRGSGPPDIRQDVSQVEMLSSFETPASNPHQPSETQVLPVSVASSRLARRPKESLDCANNVYDHSRPRVYPQHPTQLELRSNLVTDDAAFVEDAEADEDHDGSLKAEKYELEAIRIDEIPRYWYNMIEPLSQKGLKHVCQCWINEGHPKKQGENAYNGGKDARTRPGYDQENPGRDNAPVYWPRQEGWRECLGCRHREPHHIRKGERQRLVEHLLHWDRRHHVKDCPTRFDFTVDGMERSTMHVIERHPKDFPVGADKYLAALYNARRQEIRWELGEIDGQSTIHVFKTPPRKPESSKRTTGESEDGFRTKKQKLVAIDAAQDVTAGPSTSVSSLSLNPNSEPHLESEMFDKGSSGDAADTATEFSSDLSIPSASSHRPFLWNTQRLSQTGPPTTSANSAAESPKQMSLLPISGCDEGAMSTDGLTDITSNYQFMKTYQRQPSQALRNASWPTRTTGDVGNDCDQTSYGTTRTIRRKSKPSAYSSAGYYEGHQTAVQLEPTLPVFGQMQQDLSNSYHQTEAASYLPTPACYAASGQISTSLADSDNNHLINSEYYPTPWDFPMAGSTVSASSSFSAPLDGMVYEVPAVSQSHGFPA